MDKDENMAHFFTLSSIFPKLFMVDHTVVIKGNQRA